MNLPDMAAASAPGRVHGLGRLFSDEVHVSLAAALPPQLRPSLRREFEWYGCRGAFFHNPAHFGEGLFGAWCVAGPPRDIVFARAGLRAPDAPGNWVIFDPFEPHAELDAGARTYVRQRYEDSTASLFLGFELGLDNQVKSAFGIGPARRRALLLSSSVAINAETGELN